MSPAQVGVRHVRDDPRPPLDDACRDLQAGQRAARDILASIIAGDGLAVRGEDSRRVEHFVGPERHPPVPDEFPVHLVRADDLAELVEPEVVNVLLSDSTPAWTRRSASRNNACL